MFRRFLKFYWQAKTKRRISSPFVVSLIEAVIEDQREYYCFGRLLGLRMRLEQNSTSLEVTDLGAGSRVNNHPVRKISSIAKSAVSPKWQCEFLFRLVHYFQPKNRIELGTSLGLCTMYQYFPVQNSSFHSLEGCPNIAKVAAQNFKSQNANNIHIHVGDFNKTLPKVLEKMERLDYAFIDGNHQKEPTLSYFEQCLKYTHEDSLLVFDDIHWSEEMEAAWETIKKHPKVKLSIDLFYMGIVFLKNEAQEAQHYNIIPTKYKPF